MLFRCSNNFYCCMTIYTYQLCGLNFLYVFVRHPWHLKGKLTDLVSRHTFPNISSMCFDRYVLLHWCQLFPHLLIYCFYDKTLYLFRQFKELCACNNYAIWIACMVHFLCPCIPLNSLFSNILRLYLYATWGTKFHSHTRIKIISEIMLYTHRKHFSKNSQCTIRWWRNLLLIMKQRVLAISWQSCL
jgi:hypothetical protein